MKQRRSFLVINPYGIGDVLFSTPLIRTIKRTVPDAKIYYLCNQRTHEVVKNNPLIDDFVIYERDRFEDIKKRSFWAWVLAWVELIKRIRSFRIDVALDLSLNSLFGLICLASGISERVGLDYRKRGRFLTKKLPIPGFSDKHVCDYYLSLLPIIDLPNAPVPMEVFTDKESDAWVEDYFKKNDIHKNGRIIGIAPCGGQAFGEDAYIKRWPEEHFSVLINKLHEDHNATVFIFAGPNEKPEVQRILSRVVRPQMCHEFTDTSLQQLISLVEQCDLFISNDTGPLRFADALQKKIIAFFGPVDEQVYGLYPFDETRHVYMTHEIACRPCYRTFRLKKCEHDRECLRAISVDAVMERATFLLNK